MTARAVRRIAAIVGFVAVNAAQSATLPPDSAILVPTAPSVAVTGAATTTVANDRMHAGARIEVENASATAAANEVNARMARALARAKAVAGVEVRSGGYSTWQQWEKGRPSSWRVVQSLQLTSGDFAALAGLLTRLQVEDGMLLSGMSFSVAPETRRKAEDSLTREAIRAWQQRAATAADALGYSGWRVGRITVSTGDVASPRPEVMMMRAQAAGGAPPPPVAVEGGTTELTVTVTGDAQLDNLKPR